MVLLFIYHFLFFLVGSKCKNVLTHVHALYILKISDKKISRKILKNCIWLRLRNGKRRIRVHGARVTSSRDDSDRLSCHFSDPFYSYYYNDWDVNLTVTFFWQHAINLPQYSCTERWISMLRASRKKKNENVPSFLAFTKSSKL